MSKLLPCPFCGSHIITTKHGMGEWWVMCEECKAGSSTKNTRENAIAAWNTRQPDPLLEEMAMALEDLVERADRGRRLLQDGPRCSGGNWGIFDTTSAKRALQKYLERNNKCETGE